MVNKRLRGHKVTVVTGDGQSEELRFPHLPKVGDVVAFKSKFYRIRQFHWHCPELTEELPHGIAVYIASLEDVVAQ